MVFPSRLPVPRGSRPVRPQLGGSEGDAPLPSASFPTSLSLSGCRPIEGEQGLLGQGRVAGGSELVPNPALLDPQAGVGQSGRALSTMVTPKALKGRGGCGSEQQEELCPSHCV